MKYCIHCGKEIEDNDIFCPFCGEENQGSDENELYSQPQNYVHPQPYNNYDQYNNNKTGSFLPKLLIAAVILVLTAAVIFLIVQNTKGEQEYVVVNNGTAETDETTISDDMTDGQESEEDYNEENSDVPTEAEEYEGHHYLVVDDHCHWTDARDRCEEMGGHLACVTSIQEQSFIESLIEYSGSKKNYWIGGTDSQKEGDWSWITGEAWKYDNWRTGQPDDYKRADDQDYLQIGCGSTDSDRYMKWWDMQNSGNSEGYEGYPNFKRTEFFGYICEWDE